MIAGRMKDRLRILQPVIVSAGMGTERREWKETKVAHAERVKMTGSNTLQLGENFPGYLTEWNIRDGHTIDENWRVQHIGGYLYTVKNIIPNKDRGMLTLRCERVNE